MAEQEKTRECGRKKPECNDLGHVEVQSNGCLSKYLGSSIEYTGFEKMTMHRTGHPSMNIAWSLVLISHVAMAGPMSESEEAGGQSIELLKQYCENVGSEEEKDSDEYRSVCPDTFEGGDLQGYETIDAAELETRLSRFEQEITRLDESISSLEKTRNSLRSELRRREVDWNSQVPGIKTAVRPVSMAELDDLRERINNVQFEIDKLEKAKEINEARYGYLKSMKAAAFGEGVQGSE